MKKVAKFLLTFMIGIFFSIPFVKVNAESEPVKVYLFYGNGCPYCENAISYFASIEAEYGDKLITLSTCDNSEEDGRFVVVAKKVN